MRQGADERNQDFADAVKITGKRISQKAEDIEKGNNFHIGAGIFKRFALCASQHKTDR